jgi:hypothetical protein
MRASNHKDMAYSKIAFIVGTGEFIYTVTLLIIEGVD